MHRRQRRATVAAMRRNRSWTWVRRDIDANERARHPAIKNIVAAFYNDVYSVQIFHVPTDIGLVQHLIVRGQLNNQEPGWADLQRIKNELIGADREAIQVYPPADDVVDQADLYHLWVMPRDARVPFGLHRENGLVGKAKTARDLRDEQGEARVERVARGRL